MTLNEKQITELSEKYGMHKWQIEDMIKISDFKDIQDFTDDGAVMNEAMLRELKHAWSEFMKLKDPKKSQRALRLYHELFDYLLKELNKKKSDFTDDGNFPVTNKLYSLMTQILNILNRQMNRLEKEISKMTDKERDRLYDHPFIKEFKIDLLP